MPAKSRRKRGKNIPPSKRTKISDGTISAAVQTKSPESTIQSDTVVESPIKPEKKVSSQIQTSSVRYPFISSELRTIGIIAVLVLIILGILAIVL